VIFIVYDDGTGVVDVDAYGEGREEDEWGSG
jgi:hypothetical protein